MKKYNYKKINQKVQDYDDYFSQASEGSTTKVSNWTEKDAESLTGKNQSDDVTSGEDDLPLPEMEGLWYMSQSKKHQVFHFL